MCIMYTVPMSAASVGNLLTSLLLFFCSARIFFIGYAAVDSLSVIAPIALLTSIAQIAANGADAISVVLCIIALFAFITNLHALSRLASALVVDHYGALFICFSVVSLVSSTFLSFLIVYFFPPTIAPKDMQKMGIVKENVRYIGTFADGFEEAKLFEKADAEVHIIAPTFTATDERLVVIVIPDKRAGIAGYEQYMAYLAAEGCTVMTGDFAEGNWLPQPFGARPFRRLSLLLLWLFDSAQFDKQHEFFTFAEMHEAEALLDIAAKRFGECNVSIVSDGMSSLAAETVAKEASNNGKNIAVYPLAVTLDKAGLGFVRSADPLLAWHLGLTPSRTLETEKQAAKDTAASLRQDNTIAR